MLFSSITFLYIFLPVTVLLYYFVPRKGRNLVLFAVSIFFYAWGEPVYVLLMLVQILLSYVLVWLADSFRQRRAAGIFYILSVLLPFAALFYFKYFSFFMDTVFHIKTKETALPIGISFYTFQIVSYCVDVYHQRVERQKNFITYAAYVTLFPQLVAGPIVRYSEIERTLVKGAGFQDMHVNFGRGAVRFAVGLGKKVLLANVLGEFVTEVTALGSNGFHQSLALSWAYAAAVSLQIYFDFSGYSDMAIGLGSILGFPFPENFRYPFIAKSVSEFWRRWHMTLGAWFRDYVYIPMGGNRVSTPRWIRNILVVWLFTGLWHGAGWNFIVWGLLFAVLLVFEKWLGGLCAGKAVFPKYMVCVLRHMYLIIVVLISFLIFHNDSLSGAAGDIRALFFRAGGIGAAVQGTDLAVRGYLLRNRIVILLAGVICATPIPLWLWTRIQERLGVNKAGAAAVRALRGVLAVGLLILCTAYLIDGSFNPFLYFRF